MIFSKICSEGGDFLRIIEITWLFQLQPNQGDQISGQSGALLIDDPKPDKSGTFSDIRIQHGEPTVLKIIRNINTQTHNQAFNLLV